LEDEAIMGKKDRVYLFTFDEVWTKNTRCEKLVQKAWLGSEGNCITKLASIQTLYMEFKEYR